MSAIIPILASIDWLQVALVLTSILFFISELLGNIPKVKANSVYQLIRSGLIKLMSLLKKVTKNKLTK